MDNIPVEVIGNILSHVGSARDAVVASATCKKWREAWCNHLHTLSFKSCDWPLYNELTTANLEALITNTIFQTKALEFLNIFMDEKYEFSAAPVIAWLMYTRASLRRLEYNVRTTPNFNIFGKFNRQSLEILTFGHNSVTLVELSYLRFPCLKSLSLNFVSISALDLSFLLSACPKLEIFSLVNLEITSLQASVKLSSSSLKDIFIESFALKRFILKAELLEQLYLKDCNIDDFKLIGMGTLKVLKIDDVGVNHFDTDGMENLKTVDLCHFVVLESRIFHVITRASKLYKLRLWSVIIEDEDDVVDVQRIALSFPRLTHLSLSYDLRDRMLRYGLRGLSCLMNLAVLEVGWNEICDLFPSWVARLLEGCPNLKKLLIYGYISQLKTPEDCRIFSKFSAFMLQLGRKYRHVKFEFEFE